MKKLIFAIASISLLLLTSCTGTRITNTWRQPDKTISIPTLSKVLVVALFNDETNRRKAEDEMVGYLKGKGMQSYKYLDNKISSKNEEAIREKIKADGFDGAVTMRLVDVDKDKVYSPNDAGFYPSYNRNFSGYFFRNWTIFSDPSYYVATKTYVVETNVYSIKEDNIIWSGLTESSDPGGVKKMTSEISKAVFKEMKKEGFIVNK
jgi:hypothetical protein